MLISYFILFYNEDFILKMILFHFISVPVLYMFLNVFLMPLSLLPPNIIYSPTVEQRQGLMKSWTLQPTAMSGVRRLTPH